MVKLILNLYNMRTTKIIVITLIAAMGVFKAQAQYKDNAIKLNLFASLISQYQVGYERALNEHVSVQLQAGVILREWESLDGEYEDWDQNGFIIIPEGRYYFSEGLKGAYAAGFMRYRSVSWVITDLETTDGYNNSWKSNRSAIGGGLTFGYQALLSDALVIDIFAGPQFKSVTSGGIEFTENNDPDFDAVESDKAEGSGTGVRFGVNIGYAF